MLFIIAFWFNAFSTLVSLVIVGILAWSREKDYSVYLKIQIFAYNSVLGASNAALTYFPDTLFLPTYDPRFIFSVSLNFYGQFVNSMLAYYISWSLFTIITRENIDILKGFKKYTLSINALSIVLATTVFVLLFFKKIDEFCYLYDILLVWPGIVILIIIVFYHCKIRELLKIEYQSENIRSISKRLLVKCLVMYPFLYVIVPLSNIYAFIISVVYNQDYIFQIFIGILANGLFIFSCAAVYISSSCWKRCMVSVCLKKSPHNDEELYNNYLLVSCINDPGHMIELIGN